MGIQFGPRLPQVSSALLSVDPRSTAGIANSYTNLISDPENMAGWTFVNNSSVTSNVLTAPDGTLTADMVTDNTTNGGHYISKWSIPVTLGATYTLSVFAKAGTSGEFSLTTNGSFGNAIFNLRTGTAAAGVATPAGFSIIPVGNDWYRCSVTTVAATSTNLEWYFWMLQNGSFVYSGNNGTIYFWGAHMTQTSTLQEYIPQSVISSANRLTIITNPLSTVNTASSVLSNVTQSQVEYTTPGVYNWLCPAGVTSVSVVCVGGGGGGGFGDAVGAGGAGGNLRYANNIPVVPGQSYQVIVGAGGAVGGAGQTSRSGGASIFGSNLVVAQGGLGGGAVPGTATTSSNVGIGSNGGSGGINSDGGGGGAGGYIIQPASAGILQVTTNQFDATSLGAVTSIDTIAAHPTASILPSSGFLKYFIAKSAGPQEVTVFFRKTGATLSQSAFVTEGGILNYTSSINSILFYANDDHDSMFVDADGRGMIARSNVNLMESSSWDKFQGTTEVSLNLPFTSTTFHQPISGATTIVTFPLTQSSVTFNFTLNQYRVNGGGIFTIPSPLTGMGSVAAANSIWTISDGVNQFLIGRYGNSTAYLVTVDLTTNNVTASSISITAPTQTNTTEEDAVGTQLFAADGVATWCSNTIYYYGGTLDWKTNTNVFNTSGKLTFTAGTLSTQTDMDIWGSIDSSGYVWFADWGHDDGGLFNVGNDDRLGTRQTNTRYAPTFASVDLSGPGGGAGGGNFATQPAGGVGGGGGGGGSGSGGAGGGGVGLYGYTNDGAAGTTRPVGINGIQQGGGGSGGTGGAIKNIQTDLAVQTGGLYGGGGGGGWNGGPGGSGAVRIMWGPDRSYPFKAANVDSAYASSSSSLSLTSTATLNSATYENGYLVFSGSTSSYATISNVPNTDYLTINAAVFLSNWASSTGTFISNADADGTTRYQLGINNASYSGQVGAIFRTRLGNLVVGFSRAGITSGWHMLTATFDGSAARLYIDGSLVATTSAASATLLENTGYNTMTLAARLAGSTVSDAIACRIGNLSLLSQAYSATDVVSQFSSLRGRYGI